MLHSRLNESRHRPTWLVARAWLVGQWPRTGWLAGSGLVGQEVSPQLERYRAQPQGAKGTLPVALPRSTSVARGSGPKKQWPHKGNGLVKPNNSVGWRSFSYKKMGSEKRAPL